MLAKSQVTIFLIMGALVITLTGCAGTAVSEPIKPVENQTVEVQMQYVDGSEVGSAYQISVTVPTEWVGQFETRSEGNTLYFDYVTETGTPAQIFFIEALSPAQYWKQSGAHPGSYVNIVNRGDTFFTYHLPIDSFYSGLPDEEFTALAEAVPEVVASFTAEAVN